MMKTMLTTCILCLAILAQAHRPIVNPENNLIQVAICLDTSGSMSGLINQAKSQLWSILNTLSDASLDGQTARIEMAIYEYGNDRLSAKNGWVIQRSGFTTDVDKISEILFSMTTNGGEEYCGEVIHQSITDLEWRKQAGLKVLYIAGNEAFSQGAFDFRVSCMEASQKGVVINTIYCGDRQEGINTDWEAGAILGKGAFHHINHNAKTQYVQTPYDDKISALNLRLNKTYKLYYGAQGQEKYANQSRQDTNAGSYSSANAAKRAIYKSKKQYNNAEWDLVDAYREKQEVIEDEEQLPPALKDKSKKEIVKEIKALYNERTAIQEEISELAKKREAYVQKAGAKNESSLGAAMKKSARCLLSDNGFE